MCIPGDHLSSPSTESPGIDLLVEGVLIGNGDRRLSLLLKLFKTQTEQK